MIEEWKPVVGYEGLYEISNLGRVKRLERHFIDSAGHHNRLSEMFMKEGTTHEVILCKNGHYENKLIRSLVAEAFLGLEYGHPISHVDRDIGNARLDNIVDTVEFRKMDPNWRDIPGWEGEYQASRFGEIRSVDRYTSSKNGKYRYCPGVVRVLDISDDGYYQIALYRNGRSVKATNAHIFVAQAWIPNPENKPTVNHINGIKTDNRIENLEWATYSEQQEHVKRTGLRKKPWWSLEQNGPVGGDWNERQKVRVRCIETGIEYDSMTAAAQSIGQSASEIKSSIDKHSSCKGLHFVRADCIDYITGVISLKDEEWRDIPGYEGRYKISNMRRVKSVTRIVNCARGVRTVPEKLLNLDYGVELTDADGWPAKYTIDELYREVFG